MCVACGMWPAAVLVLLRKALSVKHCRLLSSMGSRDTLKCSQWMRAQGMLLLMMLQMLLHLMQSKMLRVRSVIGCTGSGRATLSW